MEQKRVQNLTLQKNRDRTVFSINGFETLEYLYGTKLNDLYTIAYAEINFRWFVYLKMEKNRGIILKYTKVPTIKKD